MQLVTKSIQKIFMNVPSQQEQLRLPVVKDARYRAENSLNINFEQLSSKNKVGKKDRYIFFITMVTCDIIVLSK